MLEVRHTQDTVELDLTGDWRVLELPEIEAALAQIDLTGPGRILIGTEHLRTLDLSSAWVLREFIAQARENGFTVAFRGAAPDQLRLIDQTLARGAAQPSPVPAPAPEPAAELLAALGRHAVGLGRDLHGLLAFLGHATVTFGHALMTPRRLRPISVARHIYDTGITAMPIVALIAFLISVIVAYMSAQQLRNYGAEVFVVDLTTIGVLRELGVLLTAIIVAGRSGSSFAAEIGSMQLNEEVDALYATGVDPFEVLVVPRVIGLVIALPLLTIIADIVGLMGGALLCHYLLEMPLSQYLTRVNDAISPSTFWVGLIKAPFFALVIALAGCRRGMQVRGSSRELGHLVTVAVVQAIFMVILADALFAVLFMEINI